MQSQVIIIDTPERALMVAKYLHELLREDLDKVTDHDPPLTPAQLALKYPSLKVSYIKRQIRENCDVNHINFGKKYGFKKRDGKGDLVARASDLEEYEFNRVKKK
jgi:hypothetical protein